MTDPEMPEPAQQTAYDRAGLAEAYGTVPVRTETFAVSEQKYDAVQAAAATGELGGARVRVAHPDERATLLVSNRGEAGWDIPGGAREADESPEETAVRECFEEVSLRVELQDLLRSHKLSFQTPEQPPVSGLWLHFAGVPLDDPELTSIADDELEAAEWWHEPPAAMDEFAQAAIESFFE